MLLMARLKYWPSTNRTMPRGAVAPSKDTSSPLLLSIGFKRAAVITSGSVPATPAVRISPMRSPHQACSGYWELLGGALLIGLGPMGLVVDPFWLHPECKTKAPTANRKPRRLFTLFLLRNVETKNPHLPKQGREDFLGRKKSDRSCSGVSREKV